MDWKDIIELNCTANCSNKIQSDPNSVNAAFEIQCPFLTGRLYKYTPLLYACFVGNVEIAEMLIYNGADLTVVSTWKLNRAWMIENSIFQTERARQASECLFAKNSAALHLACSRGNVDIVELLISHNIDLEAKDKMQETALHKSCAFGDLGIVNILLRNGADINAQEYNGNTPLHFACRNNHFQVVQELIGQEADLNLKNIFGKGPLFSASSVKIANELILNGAECGNYTENATNLKQMNMKYDCIR